MKQDKPDVQEELGRLAAQFAPAAFDMFGDDDDMFANNAENDPQPAPAAPVPSARVSALSTPRVSFSFPEVMGDSNGSTPRLHSTSPTDSPWQLQQQGEPAAAADQSQASAAAADQSPAPATAADESREPAAAADQSRAAENGTADKRPNGAAPATEIEVDYQSWPIKELRRFLTERGLVSGLALVP